MNTSIFDWRAVPFASWYQPLDPQKTVQGLENQCRACGVIYAAFKAAGLDLRTWHGGNHLSLFKMHEKAGLLLAAGTPGGHGTALELYTAGGEPFTFRSYFNFVIYSTDYSCPASPKCMTDCVCCLDNPFSPWKLIVPKTHVSYGTASEMALDRMVQWIRDCNENHSRCTSEGSVALPTRLLDLGASNDSIKLIETDGSQGPYICLSHCWGTSSTVLCTRETYDEFRNHVPWTSLPLLFRDAIEMCRVLKVQYLWIDKLCIIQHDQDDWVKEGARMSQVFEGSYLTIAAAVAGNDRDSLFRDGGEQATSVKSHHGCTEDGLPYTIHSRIPFKYHPADGSIGPIGDRGYPLLLRGWVYQERLLGPRVLYFGQELSWECRETSACECSGAARGIKKGHSLSLLPGQSEGMIHSQWQTMVEHFTWLQLSFERDRLPALSGLAHQTQRLLKSAYLAGLWKDYLAADLMWYAYPANHLDAPRYYTQKPREWRAPSWSWASVDGPVRFLKDGRNAGTGKNTGREFRLCLEIVSAETTPSSLDPMGTVAAGQVVVVGSSRPGLLRHLEAGMGDKSRHYTCEQLKSDTFRIQSHFTVDGEEAHVDYDLIEHGLMKPNSELSITCLDIAETSSVVLMTHGNKTAHWAEPKTMTWSLLLRRIEGEKFERVGLLNVRRDQTRKVGIDLQECAITIV